MAGLDIDERDFAVAHEHPRGTERRTLQPYREALSDLEAYARLPVGDREVIVRWAEVRRRLAEDGLDRDPANLADPLLPYAALRSQVIAGERRGDEAPAGDDLGCDLRTLVAAIRAG